MASLYVPIIVNDELNKNRANLFSIATKEIAGKKSEFNGRDVYEFNSKLKKTFSQSFSFDIYEYGKDKKSGVFKNFSENTSSISLGVYCTAYATAYNRQLREKYDSITVTGNYDIDDDKKIILTDVIFLEEKFRVAQQYAKNHADKRHLFIYVSKNTEIEEGETDNLLVIRFSPTDSINLVFAEIFEPVYTVLQQQSLIPLVSDVNFIETKGFLVEKKKLARVSDWHILLFYGEQNSGKTLVAKELCKYLMTVNNCTCDVCSCDEKLEEIILENRKCKDNETFYNYIKEKLSDEDGKISYSDILLLDNVQTTKIEELVICLKKLKKYKNIIITVWYAPQIIDNNVICCSILSVNVLSFEQFSNFIKNITAPDKIRNNQSEFSELIYLLYEKYKNLIGYIPTIIRTLPNNGLRLIIKEIQNTNFSQIKFKNEFALKQALKYMDFLTQSVLFSIIGNRLIGDVDGKFAGKKLNYSIILNNIKNVLLKVPNVLTDFMIQDSLTKLASLNIIQICKSKRRGEFVEMKDSIVEGLLFSSFEDQTTMLIKNLFVNEPTVFVYAKKYKKTEFIIKHVEELNVSISDSGFPRLKDFADIFQGLHIPGRERTKQLRGDGYLIIKPQYIFDHKVHLGNSSKYYCSKEYISSMNAFRFFLRKGDIVVAKTGKCNFAVYDGENECVIANSNVAIIRPYEDSQKVFEEFFSSELGIKYFDKKLKLLDTGKIYGDERVRNGWGLPEITIPPLSMLIEKTDK